MKAAVAVSSVRVIYHFKFCGKQAAVEKYYKAPPNGHLLRFRRFCTIVLWSKPFVKHLTAAGVFISINVSYLISFLGVIKCLSLRSAFPPCLQCWCSAYACGAESLLAPSRSHSVLLVLSGPCGFGWPGCKRACGQLGRGWQPECLAIIANHTALAITNHNESSSEKSLLSLVTTKIKLRCRMLTWWVRHLRAVAMSVAG